MQLLSLTPNRTDQATPLISYYLNNENDDGVKRICYYFDSLSKYHGYCDLALGGVYIKEGNFDAGINLIKRANENGMLDYTGEWGVDKETADHLKSLITKFD